MLSKNDVDQGEDSRDGRVRATHWSVSRHRPQLIHYRLRCSLCFSFINNEWHKGVDGKTFEVINPSDESVICSVHEATEKDVDIAVAAARKAFNGEWRETSPETRGKLLNNLANLFEKNLDLLAAVESLDNGKAFSMAKGDVGACAGCLRYYGGWADKIEGKVIDTSHDTFNYIRKEPVCLHVYMFTCVRHFILTNANTPRSAFAVRLFLGTSHCLCYRGK